MSYRRLASTAAVAAVIAALSLIPAAAAGQASKSAAKTEWGEPDLRGVWRNETPTPLERPAELAGREFYTEEEAAKRAVHQPLEAIEGASPQSATQPAGTYNRTWQYTGKPPTVFRRTSMIVGPTGRIPFTPEAAKRQEKTRAHYGQGPYNSWLDIDTGERCITDGLVGSTWIGTAGGPTQILQSRGWVVIRSEQYQDRRIVPTDGRPHGKIRHILGEGVGHWEGDTLVVETKNFLDKSNYWWVDEWRVPTETLRLVERFTRVDADTINYQLTVEDPAKFTEPWTVEFPFTNIHQPFLEYACHEGNYGVINTLAGERGRETGKIFEHADPNPVEPPSSQRPD